MELSEIAQTIERDVPSPHRDVFHDGVAQGIVISEQGFPDAVLPRLDQYSMITARPMHNGLRIGLWRLFKSDPLQGIAIAQAYPRKYHNALFEELGWLLGSDYIEDLSVGWVSWKHRIPEHSRCALAHGRVSGLVDESPCRGSSLCFPGGANQVDPGMPVHGMERSWLGRDPDHG